MDEMFKAEITIDEKYHLELAQQLKKWDAQLTGWNAACIPGLTLVQKTIASAKEVHRRIPGSTNTDKIIECFKGKEWLKVGEIGKRVGISGTQAAASCNSLLGQGRLNRRGNPGTYEYQIAI